MLPVTLVCCLFDYLIHFYIVVSYLYLNVNEFLLSSSLIQLFFYLFFYLKSFNVCYRYNTCSSFNFYSTSTLFTLNIVHTLWNHLQSYLQKRVFGMCECKSRYSSPITSSLVTHLLISI